MPHLNVVKGHGCGEDVVVVDGAPADFADLADTQASLVRRLCDRRGPIGAQGVFFLDDRSAQPQAWYFDRAGRQADPDPHGLRVAGRLVLDRRAQREAVLQVGVVHYPVRRLADSPEGSAQVAVELPAIGLGAGPHVVGDRRFNAVTVPTLQLVSVVGSYLESELLAMAGKAAGQDPAVPQDADISFLMPLSAADEVFVRTYEHGVGLARSSGAGVVASRAAYSRVGATAPDVPVLVRTPGGPARAEIAVTGTQWHPTLSGNATFVFGGEIDLDLLMSGAGFSFDMVSYLEEVMAFSEIEETNRRAIEAAGVRYT